MDVTGGVADHGLRARSGAAGPSSVLHRELMASGEDVQNQFIAFAKSGSGCCSLPSQPLHHSREATQCRGNFQGIMDGLGFRRSHNPRGFVLHELLPSPE